MVKLTYNFRALRSIYSNNCVNEYLVVYINADIIVINVKEIN